MKRTITILLAALIAMSAVILFAGCSKIQTPGAGESTPEQTMADTSEDAEASTQPEESTSPTQSDESTAPVTASEGGAVETSPVENPAAASAFIACSIKTDSLGELKYWLYTPSAPTANMPLIVYLHGGSGKGDDLELITAVDGFPKYLRDGQLGDVRAYVVIPQLPASQKGWANGASAVYDLIQVTESKFGIDRQNISLTGHSMGGTGTWNLALAYPQLFSKIAPLSGSIRVQPEYIEKLKNIPVWAFVGSADTIVPPDSSMEFVAALKEAGGVAGITVFGGADHFTVPSLTYLDEDINLVNWLIDNVG